MSSAVPIQRASTVMLLRDGHRGVEVFTLRRAATMVFGPGMTAFPGGGVADADADPAIPWLGPDADWWAEQWRIDIAAARAHVVAAVRELCEEVGVLLASPDDGGASDGGAADGGAGGDAPAQTLSAARAAMAAAQGNVINLLPDADRVALAEHRLTMAAALQRHRSRLRADLLKPWSRWITPAGPPRRYDTLFFVAALPAGQNAALLTTEASEGRWELPGDVLDRYSAREVEMMPPTVSMMEDLAESSSVSDVLEMPRDVAPITPTVLTSDGEVLRVRVGEREFSTRMRMPPTRP